MKLVRAALGDDTDLPAGSSAEFRRRHAGLHGELLHGVGYPEVPQR